MPAARAFLCLIVFLSLAFLTGCQKAETVIRVHNSGPEKITNVTLTIGGTVHSLGNIEVEETAKLVVPPIMGRGVTVGFDELDEGGKTTVAQGVLDQDAYGEIVIGITENRVKQTVAGHAP